MIKWNVHFHSRKLPITQQSHNTERGDYDKPGGHTQVLKSLNPKRDLLHCDTVFFPLGLHTPSLLPAELKNWTLFWPGCATCVYISSYLATNKCLDRGFLWERMNAALISRTSKPSKKSSFSSRPIPIFRNWNARGIHWAAVRGRQKLGRIENNILVDNYLGV